MAVFVAQKTVSDWRIALSREAADIAGVLWWHASVDQYSRMSGSAWSKPDGKASCPSDLQGMLSRFVREAVNWTREQYVLPRRTLRQSVERGLVCTRCADIANARLARLGLFCHGVDDHGLRMVFRDLLAERDV